MDGEWVPVEVEAKLRGSRQAFRALERALPPAADVAGWQVVERREVRLRDTYWDTPDHRLAGEGRTLRVRELNDTPEAELTLKGAVRGAGPLAAARTELTAAVPAGSGPAQWATLRAAGPIWAALRRDGVAGGLRPDIVLLNPRRELVLRYSGHEPDGGQGAYGGQGRPGGCRERGERGAGEAVLSLDEVRIEGQPYGRRYVEIELRRGPREAFDRLTQAVATQFGLRPARQGKVQAARAWLESRRGPRAARHVVA